MSREVTIVMYHYVRDLEHSRFPAIKGLSVERFCRQLDHIQARYTPIAADDLMEALSPAKKELPTNPILLTFDDGYSDHFTNVFPTAGRARHPRLFLSSGPGGPGAQGIGRQQNPICSRRRPRRRDSCSTRFSPLWRNFVRSMRSRPRKTISWHVTGAASLRFPRSDRAQTPPSTRAARAGPGGNRAAAVRRARDRRRGGFRLRIVHVSGPDRLPAAPWNAHRQPWVYSCLVESYFSGSAG